MKRKLDLLHAIIQPHTKNKLNISMAKKCGNCSVSEERTKSKGCKSTKGGSTEKKKRKIYL